MRRFSLLLVACLALLAAGCGEDAKEKFTKDYKPVNQKIIDLGEDVGQAVQGAEGKSDAALEKQFGELAQRTGRLQQDVDALEAPEDLKADQDKLTEAMGDAQNALDGIEKAAGDNDANAARESAQDLVQSSEELRDARRALAKATGAKQ